VTAGAVTAAATDAVGALAARVADALPGTRGSMLVQSDLTAVVSGRQDPAAMRVLAAAAVPEAGGAATVWRFTPASVRDALDAGWTAAELLAELAAGSDRPLPQPLEYLVADVARRHGQVRVRATRACVVADEATAEELLHTRSLARLRLARLAPTVLASPCEPAEVLARLRADGSAPVSEDANGAVVVGRRTEHRAAAPAGTAPASVRLRVPAVELADRLIADSGGAFAGPDASAAVRELAELGPQLSDAEVELLADAVERHREVLITYRNRAGNQTVRVIQPRQIVGPWLTSWCQLRGAERDFTVANIESVAPAG